MQNFWQTVQNCNSNHAELLPNPAELLILRRKRYIIETPKPCRTLPDTVQNFCQTVESSAPNRAERLQNRAELTKCRERKEQRALTKNAESAAPLHVSPHVSLHFPVHAHLHAPLDVHLHVLRNVVRQRCAECQAVNLESCPKLDF